MDFCLEYQWPPDGSERSILVPLQEAMRFLGDRKLVSKHPGILLKFNLCHRSLKVNTLS